MNSSMLGSKAVRGMEPLFPTGEAMEPKVNLAGRPTMTLPDTTAIANLGSETICPRRSK